MVAEVGAGAIVAAAAAAAIMITTTTKVAKLLVVKIEALNVLFSTGHTSFITVTLLLELPTLCSIQPRARTAL